MAANDPSGLHELFTKYFNSGDVDGLLTLYEDGASLIAGRDAALSGKDAIRAGLEGYLALKPTIEFIDTGVSYEVGDLALTHARFRMQAEGIDDVEATTAEVARRQSDGTWKYLIDNPFGGGILDAQ